MPVIQTIKSWASVALLVALLALSATVAYLWHNKGVTEAQVQDLVRQRDELSMNLKAEQEWSAKLSAELAERQKKQAKSNGQKKAAEDKLDKSYEENRSWADAPVPGAVDNGLRDFLSTR